MDLTNSNLSSVSIGSHEKSNNFVSDKPSLKSYATRVFQGSSIGIVSSIFSTHSKRRRFFKVFFSSLCTAGFIYHCITFLSHVWTYPEVVSISVDRSKTYILPAYTYCFNNPIARSVFCSLDPQYCVQPSKEFCRNFSSYCGANATLIPKKEYYNELPRSFQAQWILNFGRVQNILEGDITGHEWFSRRKEISGPYLRTPYSFYDLKPCYSIHSLVESNLEPLLKSRPDAGTFPFFRDDTLRFHLNETEMLNPESEPGVYFSVHSPFEAVNPFTKGIFLKSGKTYRLYVKMVSSQTSPDNFLKEI